MHSKIVFQLDFKAIYFPSIKDYYLEGFYENGNVFYNQKMEKCFNCDASGEPLKTSWGMCG